MFTQWRPLYQRCFLSQHCMLLRQTAHCRVTKGGICFIVLLYKTGHIFAKVVGLTATMHQRSFQQSFRSSSASKGGRGPSGKMFFVARNRNVAGQGNERRSIYQKFRDVDLLDKKPGEDRAIFLGLGMILSSVMMYFVLGITILRSYAESVWTEEGVCVVLNSTVTADMNCSYNCGSECWRASKYPCLQVYVSVNNTGRVRRLSHNEESKDTSSECVYVPRCQKDRVAMHVIVMNISEHLKVNQQVPCYYDPSEQQEAVLLTRLYDHRVVFHSLLWPSCMLTGGALVIVMVKLTQYLSRRAFAKFHTP